MVKAIIIKDKKDALRHIEALYPIGQTAYTDSIWLEIIDSFGIQNLPVELLAKIAERLIHHEGSEAVIDLEKSNEENMPRRFYLEIIGNNFHLLIAEVHSVFWDGAFNLYISGISIRISPQESKQVMDGIKNGESLIDLRQESSEK